MKKVFLSLLVLAIGLSAMAQQRIQLRSADRAECVKSDMTSLTASFSFSTIEAEDYASERGTFSWLSMPNTVIGGNEGEPQIPVVNQLIAVPFGAHPRIEITSYSTTDYRLDDLDIHTLVPRQPSIRKDQRPEDVPFVYKASAYQTRGLRSEPQAVVSVNGMMRGVQLGTMTIEPVSYDPVSNTLRVFNDIEVTVSFDDADVQATEDLLVKTYSPHFDVVYNQLFNNGLVKSAYTDHPDLYNTPVKMLVICYSGFEGNAALESWLQWKLQKGYYVDIYYTGTGTNQAGSTATAIASFIKTKYNASVAAGNAYTYLVVIGDTGQVPYYMVKNIDSSVGNCASDLGYASVNFSSSTSNYFPDMYYSRMSVENTTHLTNYINKVLTYEKFEMTDGGDYLNNVILVGGWDSTWTPKVAKPTINYATAYYFKSSNTTYGGFENGNIEATVSTSSTAGYAGTATGTGTTMGNGVYTSINSGVGFLNYTAHGDKQEWYQPKMTAAQVANLTNSGKYFVGVGNCCLTGNFNNTTTTYSPGSSIGTNACFAETMIRVPNAGAVTYIGCSPYSYWYEDFYWAVGAHSYSAGNYPTQSASSTGVYDAMFDASSWNSTSALLYVGNLAVQQAVTNGNTNSGATDGDCNNSAHYYFQFYHTFGDGSVMPYVTKPEANTVTLPSSVTPGSTSITVNALSGSYVAVTDNSSVIYGVAEANSSGVATVTFTNDIPSSGTLHVVVTRQQYQPYFGTIAITGGTQYEITAEANPSEGGTVSGAGTYYESSECTLTATPNTGYAFDNWTLNGTVVSTDASYTFTVTGNADYVANFSVIPQYTITATANPTEGGTVSGGGTFYSGTDCTLTATANTGYAFDNWTLNGTAVSARPSYNFTVSGNATYVANFNALTLHNITYTPQQANGTIGVSPTEAYAGDVITLTATPAEGYHLDEWNVTTTGGTTVTVTNDQFTMPDDDVTVSAVFNSGYSVTVASLIGGTITASANTAQEGDVITLTVTPNTGYDFMEWNVYQTSNPSNTIAVANNSFTMPAYDVTVSAVFGTIQTVNNEVTVGTGTTSDTYLPTYSNRKYSLSEQIYTASELGSAGTITSIEFYYSGSSARTRTLDVYMVSTTKSAFSSTTDWIRPTAADKVYSGSVAFTSGSWKEITFTTPFEYDGTNNVVIIVDDNTGTAQNGMGFYSTSMGSSTYQALYMNSSSNSNTNYNPLTITSTGSRRTYKNNVIFHITQSVIEPLACEGPTNVSVSNVTPNSATISWSGEAESYNIRYRVSAPKFTYDFENATAWSITDFSPCTIYDGDNTATYTVSGIDFDNEGYTGAFIAFQNGLSDTWASHGGDMFGVCMAANGATNNDWFILPELSIESGDQLSFWAKSITDSYGLERIKVGVYRDSGTFSSYLAGSASTYVEVPVDWTNYTYDLSDFAGQSIQLAINCVSDDAFALFIDDIAITNVGGSWDEAITNVTSPYTITGLTEETLYEVQVTGVCEGIGESAGAGTNFTTLSWCSAPNDLGYYEVSATQAILGWTGYQESYNLQYRTAGGREQYLYTGFENGLPSTWTTSGLASNSGVYSGAPNSGTYMYGFVSGSSSQYLITPELGEFEEGSLVAFYHMAYGGDVTMKIGYSSTTNATSAFTWGSAQTVASGTAYALFSEEIPTGTKYIALQVTNVGGNYYLVDDFMVVGPYVEPGEWQYVNGLTTPYAFLTDLDPETEYEWQVEGLNCDGNGGTTGLSTESYFTTGSLCDAPVGLYATDVTGNSAALNWTQDLDAYNVRYAPVSYFEGFETGMSDWTVITNGEYISDYFTEGWIDYAPSAIWSNLDAHSGYGAAMSFSYNPFGDEGVALTVDNWLISPQLDLQGTLKFWVMTNYDDPYEVLLSTAGTETTDFTVTLQASTEATYAEWSEVSIDLSNYAGQQGYIAIHHSHTDGYVLFIDDFGIYPNDWTTVENVSGDNLAVNNLEPNTDYVWQVQGVDCDGDGSTTEWSGMDSFTTLKVLELAEGWNWWTPTTDMTLDDLESTLGSKAVIINSQDGGFARCDNDEWSGTLTEITPGQMYKIQTVAAISVGMSGTAVSNVSITIMPGYNWFGYTGIQAADIATALGNIGVTPESGDTITDENGNTATYNGSSWSGNLTTLQPGHGYIYER